MSQRQQIVEEAISWLNTPWRHAAQVKGAGVDCAQFLIAVFSHCGVMPKIDTGHYPPDWHLHRDDARFVNTLTEYAAPLGAEMLPLPGDVAMWRYGRHAAHGSIVVNWPLIIHAWRDMGAVVLTDISVSPLAERFAGAYRLKGLQP